LDGPHQSQHEGSRVEDGGNHPVDADRFSHVVLRTCDTTLTGKGGLSWELKRHWTVEAARDAHSYDLKTEECVHAVFDGTISGIDGADADHMDQ